jgi:hypothetical protein
MLAWHDTPRPRLPLLRLVAFAQLALGDRYRAMIAVAFDFIVSGQAVAQDRQRRLNDGTMLGTTLVAKGLGHRIMASMQ